MTYNSEKLDNYIELLRNYSMDDFLKEAFILSDDDILNHFMTCYDVSNQYQPLDIGNIDNILYQIDDYCNESYITKFIEGIVKFYRLKFFINLNECLAHTTTSLIYDGFNPFDDCKRKFKINRIMYMRLYNYFRNSYKYSSILNGNITDEQFQNIFNNIPNDISIATKEYDDLLEVQPDSDVHIGRCIMRDFLYTSFGFMFDLEQSHYKKISLFLEKQLKYKKSYPNEEPGGSDKQLCCLLSFESIPILYKYMYGLNNMNEFLKTRYSNYWDSKLSKSLSTLITVSNLVCTEFKYTQDKIYYELEKYLSNILIQYSARGYI